MISRYCFCKYTVAAGFQREINDIHFDNIQVLNGDIPVSLIEDTRRRQKKYVSMIFTLTILPLWGKM